MTEHKTITELRNEYAYAMNQGLWPKTLADMQQTIVELAEAVWFARTCNNEFLQRFLPKEVGRVTENILIEEIVYKLADACVEVGMDATERLVESGCDSKSLLNKESSAAQDIAKMIADSKSDSKRYGNDGEWQPAAYHGLRVKVLEEALAVVNKYND